MLVGPSHTFADLADAIDTAFARWDRAHLCQFTLADGTVVTDEETAEELEDMPDERLGVPYLVLERTKVVSRLAPGEEFKYVFDLGDDWTHACRVENEKVDPREEYGGAPDRPVPIWGWGSIPDQYGRRWADDTREGRPPRRPSGRHPMRDHRWPELAPSPVDLRELRGATYRADVPALLAAIQGHDVDDVLQLVGTALLIVMAQDRERGSALAVSVANRLSLRDGPGDEVLGDDLIAELRGTPPPAARLVPVDLAELAEALRGDPFEPGDWLDLTTGEVVPAQLVDEDLGDGEEVVDVHGEPDRWHEIERLDTGVQWEDMAEFARRQADPDVREWLERALEGKGAFRRFATPCTTRTWPTPGSASPTTAAPDGPGPTSPTTGSARGRGTSYRQSKG